MNFPDSIEVVDSHTGGEPTRVVIAGGPDLGTGSLSERRDIFQSRFDDYRSAIVNEPRGSDLLVGALLCEPCDASSVCGVIFFNNVGMLGMCGHGTIGLAVTLAHLGRISKGRHRLETPVGVVTFEYHGGGKVTLENVSSYRHAREVTADVPGEGLVTGDIAWGGNWFFLVGQHQEELSLGNVERLTEFTWAIRQALKAQGITGEAQQEIDHIELFGPAANPANDSRNFVLCPGKAYDRSPCGTGTSAKIACLIESGKLQPGEIWRQESILGSLFEASGQVVDGQIIPRITGEAFITAETRLRFTKDDPFQTGFE